MGFAEALAKGEQALRPHSSTTELEQLAASIEKLRGQVDGKQYVERYVQALTHEIKSPLTALQAHAELLVEEKNQDQKGGELSTHSADRVLEQTFRIRTLVDQMLVLTRLEGGHAPRLETLDWHALLDKQIRLHQEQAALRTIDLRLDHPTLPVTVQGDENLLSLACSNLIQNAIDFSPPHATIHCWLEHSEKAWVFNVRDRGIGLSPLASTKLFERYFSTPRPSTGARSSGLGLALSKEIVQAHRGTLSIKPADPGVLASIRLPA